MRFWHIPPPALLYPSDVARALQLCAINIGYNTLSARPTIGGNNSILLKRTISCPVSPAGLQRPCCGQPSVLINILCHRIATVYYRTRTLARSLPSTFTSRLRRRDSAGTLPSSSCVCRAYWIFAILTTAPF